MFTVTFTYTRRRYQRPDRYPEETEIVYVSEAEIDAMRGQNGVPQGADREELARYVAFDKHESRAYGRACEVTVDEYPKLAKVA